MATETGEIVGIDVRSGGVSDSRSGLFLTHPRIFARIERAPSRLAFVVIHPTSNFFNHYLFGPLKRRDATLFALNTRYVGNDSTLLMERCILDLGAGIRVLRAEGYERVVLIGNSGGGSLAALYQDQAERLTIKQTPDGRPIEISAEDLPRADAIALLAAHPGRAIVLTDWLDPSVIDEADPLAADPELDMYNTDNGPPYNREWVGTYRSAQRARNERITDRVQAGLRTLDNAAADRDLPMDEPFLLFRTGADPRFLDLTLDSSDRTLGSVRGSAKATNYSVNGIARFCSLRSWLSQWSLRTSAAHGPRCLARTSVPVLSVTYSADSVVFPSQLAEWSLAAGSRCTDFELKGATHHLAGQERLRETLATVLVDWANQVT